MRTIRGWLVALTGLWLAGCQALFFRVVDSGGEASVPISRTYDSGHGLALDVYRPPHPDGPTPVVLFFYGGSWRNGDRGQYAFVGRALAARGVLAVIADYRRYPQGVFPRFEEDAAAAARWTFDHAAEFGGDARRVFVAGHSAGAHIAALLASDSHYLAAKGLAPRDFAGAIGIAGPYDFLPLTDPKLIEVFGAPDAWPASQPVRFIDGDEPPFLLLQGAADRIVDPRNAGAMADALRRQDAAVEQRYYPGVGHFRILAGLRFPSLAPTLDDVLAFVRAIPPVDAHAREVARGAASGHARK
ncbi:MAG TPA: alpha/beta hydrolase [Dokdonella sp.]|nr:alpha/beta hydrolase [Dokdonella sp.]